LLLYSESWSNYSSTLLQNLNFYEIGSWLHFVPFFLQHVLEVYKVGIATSSLHFRVS